MRYPDFLERICDRAAVGPAQAAAAVEATLQALGARLSRLEAEALADDLPWPMADFVRAPAHGQDFALPELYGRVAEREGVRTGIAMEHAVVVLQTLGARIRPEVRRRLQLELPRELGALLEPPEPAAPPPLVHLERQRHTLAEGRAGSSHPLSEGRADAAHLHSVARSTNPHGDTKLSSAEGLTQERERETLAEGRPGSSRPLSEAK